MYINFSILKKHGLTARQLLIIQGFKQSRTDEERDVLRPFETSLPNLLKKGYLKQIKGGRGLDEFSKYRIDRKGRDLLRDVEIVHHTPESIKLAADLYRLYEGRGLQQYLGNKRKLVQLVTWFLYETGLPTVDVFNKVEEHLNTDDFKFNLNNFIHKNTNVYSTSFSLANSELYNRLTK